MHEQGPLFICVWLQGRAEIILITKEKVFSYFHNTVVRVKKWCERDILILKYARELLKALHFNSEKQQKATLNEKIYGYLCLYLPKYFHTSLWFSGSHPQQLRWLKHQLKMALLELCEMKGGGDLRDLEL